MREIGILRDEAEARRFCDFLTSRDIENRIEKEPDGTCSIWVISEDDMKEAETSFAHFLVEPDAEEFLAAADEADFLRFRDKQFRDSPPYHVDVRKELFRRRPSSQGSLTIFLIIISVGIALFSGLGKNYQMLRKFFITDIVQEGIYFYWDKGLPEISRGEIWRLVTPAFIHFGFMHLLFNMLWLKDLGSMLEHKKGPWFLGLFILFTAVAGNLAQYFMSGPNFGGMSAAVYGLLGYAWMKGKHDAGSGVYLNRFTVHLMVGWYFLCLTGLMGNVANAGHTAGLLVGSIWGYLSAVMFKTPLDK